MTSTIALAGCAHGESAPASYGGAPLAPDEAAAMGDIAYARVAREQACHARPTGDGDVRGRLSLVRRETVAEIDPGWCKSKIHPRELADCISSIRRLPCGVELKNVTSLASCNVTPLCGETQDGTL